ncbi:MAG: carboxylating nicotinate-nucleotide diphosphorylase [Elusimicrobiota bacterium]|jgi:nicotinate-nucleotide pyrophosphorylase (carboxylating)|nr:carboxylating nicotinate-nucleotide diphosphorylase [Elusimicrobiota bacterium]
MTDPIIKLAVEEDFALGDITSDNIFRAGDRCKAVFVAKEDMIVCGGEAAKQVFEYVDPRIKFAQLAPEGAAVKKGARIAAVEGPTLGVLRGERAALNFMQRMSAIASVARELSAIARKYGVMLTDTRKSQPGMRKFDKYAVRTGGARNHRMSLADGVLIKDNHIAAAGGITAAVKKIKNKIGHTSKIEVETKNLKEAAEALKAGADIIMLDNMRPAEIIKAKKLISGKAVIEVSGGVNKNNLEEYCKTGVDVVSMGALTHSVPAKDISMLVIKQKINKGDKNL